MSNDDFAIDILQQHWLDENGMEEAVRFSAAPVSVHESTYKSQIVRFAEKAKELFSGTKKRFADDWERSMYDKFWAEYDQLLTS